MTTKAETTPPVDRSPRELDTREQDLRERSWAPPTGIPDPLPREGWGFRWIRASMYGDVDATNMDRAYREGWIPCAGADIPELAHLGAKDGRGQDIIVYGGLILCKRTAKMNRERDLYYNNMAAAQQHRVDSDLRANAAEDSRMPLFNTSSSKITSG